MEEKLLTLHSNLVKEGYELPDYGTFKTDMSDPLKSKKLHDSLVGEGYDLPDYDTFIGDMNLKKKDFSVLDSLTPASGKEELPFLDASGKPLTAQPQLPSEQNKGSYLGDLFERIGAGAIDFVTSGPKQLKFADRLLNIPKEIVKKELSLFGVSEDKASKAADLIPFIKPPIIGRGVAVASDVWDKIEKTEPFQNIEEKAQTLKESSDRYDKAIIDYAKNGEWKKAIGASFLGAAESLPVTLTAMFGGPVGLATIGSYSAASQYDEVSAIPDMNEFQKVSNALLNGGLEVLTEKLGSANYGQLIKSLYKTAGKEVAEDAVKAGVKNWLASMWKKLGLYTEPVGEGLEEAVNQFGSNLTARITGEDEDRPLDYQVWDAAASGTAGGTIFMGVGLPAQLRQKKYEEALKEKEKAAKAEGKTTPTTTDKGTATTEVGALEVPQAVADQKAQEDAVKAKQIEEINKLIESEKTTEPAGTITPLETKDGRDWFNVVKEDGQRQTFGVPEGSPQEVVDAKSKEYLKPLEVPYVEINSENISEFENNTISSLREQGATEEEVADVQNNLNLIKESVNERKRNELAEPTEDRTGEISLIRPEEITGDEGALGGIFRGRRDGNRSEGRITSEDQVKNTLAPNGQKSNLPTNLHSYVRTPEFAQKFGNWQEGEGSLVLDRNGEPLLIYSGKGRYHEKGIDPTRTQQKILFFTGDRMLAKDYAQFQGKQPTIYRGFVRISDADLQEGSQINNLHEGQQEFITTKKEQFIPIGIEEVPKVKKGKKVEPTQGIDTNTENIEDSGGQQGEVISIEKMNSEQLREYARNEKQRRKSQEESFFGKENAVKYREAQSVSESFTATPEQRKNAYKTIDALEKSLPKNQYEIMFGEQALDPTDVRDIAQRVELVEQAENIDDLGGALKIPLLDFAKNKNDKGALAVLNASKNKATELGIDPKEMFLSAINRIAKDLPDVSDVSLLADDILSKIVVSTEPLTKEIQAPKQPTDTATQVPSEGNVPPPPESGQIDVTESEKQGEKPLGAQERSLNQIETEQQQILSDIINENKGFYDTLHGEQAVKNANKFIEERGVDGATRELEQPTKDINEYPTRQVARMVLIDHYTRILGDPKATKEQKDNAYTATNNLQQRISTEANKTGQGNAHLNLWKVMQPAGLLEFAKRHIAEFNRVKLNRKIGDKSIGQLLDLVYKQLSDASKEVVDDILAGKEIEAQMPVDKPNVEREPAKKKTVPKEQVKAEKDYRKKLLDDYRKSQGKVTLQAGIPLTAEQIELGGNLIASYVREGYYRAVDIINKLIDDLKAIGITVTEDDLDPILSTKKEGNQTFRSWMREQEASVGLTEEMKSLKLRISDIVKMHWSQRDELGRTLAQKLVDDAGLSESEAKKLETAILTEYNKRIQDRLKSFKDLANLLGKEKVPTDKKKKTRLDRLIELVNLGALEEDVYRGLFADKFGLAPEITSEQGRIIMQKASVVQQMTDKGWFYREAVKDLTKYLYELNPTSKFNEWAETWIALSYSNMLFGYFTTILNLWSSGSNILLKPLRDATNMSRWLRAVKSNNPSGEVYMPGGEMYYMPMLQGIAHGATDAAEIYENGDVGSKYIEEITKSKQFRVGQLERDKFGKGKRFKPLKVGGIDLNIFNLNKYSGRNLSAQDRLMFNTIFEMEVASIIRRNLANTQNLTGQALSTAVMDELQGAKVDKEALNAQIEAEAAKFKELTGQETTDRQKKIRMRELMVKQLPITEEERLDAERLAQGNIFTDTRGGIVATLANAIGMLSNSNPSMGVIVKPFIPFTKIVGNVTEYMLDHVPFYGFLRANGYSVSGIKKKMNPDAMTAQMGEKGSNLYYEQMGRAWLGTMSFTVLAMMFLGSDDEDYVQISGGYNQEGFKKGGRENVMPKYTLRIGDVEISYLNIPALAIPLGLIGNINDAIKMKMPSEEISNRLAATMLLDAVANTALMTKDMSFVQGTQNLLTLLTDAMSMEEGGWKRAGQVMAKTYLGFALRPLPQNSALVQQTWKFFDPVSYSQKDIKSILAYSAGLQHFVNYPTMDQLGDEVKTYPGEALLPYTHWFNIKGDDARWRFLADNNAIPNKIQNARTYIDTEDGLEFRTLEAKELHDYTKLAGGYFSDKLTKYMGDSAKVSKRTTDLIKTQNYKKEEVVKTGIQVDVEEMWDEARKSANTSLFKWYDFKKTNAKDWDIMLSTGAVKEQPTTPIKIEIDKKDVPLSETQMTEYNQLTMEHYHERIMRYIDNKERVKEDKKRIMDNGKTRFDNKTDEEWTKARERAEKQMKRQLRDEKTNSTK